MKIERDAPYIFLKLRPFTKITTIFVQDTCNDKITCRGNTVKFEGGYWTFSMIKDRFTYELGTRLLKANKYDSTCSLEVDGEINLLKFGKLLGFDEDTQIAVNDILTSPNRVEINRGLRHISVSCNLVSSDNNINCKGGRSTVISSLPITTTQSLKNTISHYTNIESRVPIDKGSYSQIVFSVEGNNGAKNIGSVLLEVYITQ